MTWKRKLSNMRFSRSSFEWTMPNSANFSSAGAKRKVSHNTTLRSISAFLSARFRTGKSLVTCLGVSGSKRLCNYFPQNAERLLIRSSKRQQSEAAKGFHVILTLLMTPFYF